MAYTLIDFNAPASNFAADIAAAKKDGSYEASKKTFDQAVLKTLAGLVKSCLGHTEDFAKLVGDRHKACKGVLDQMEAILKKKGKALDVSDMKVLETAARSIKNHSTTLGETSGDMFKALTQFRGGWPATYRPLLSTPAALEPLVNARLKSIDEGKQVDALKTRVEQYAERAQDILKAAQKLAAASSGAQAQPGQGEGDTKEFEGAVAKLKNEAETFAGKATNSLKQMAETDPKQKPDANTMKAYESRMVNGRAEAKSARGSIKSLSLKIDMFKKTLAKMDNASKPGGAKALADAGKVLKDLEAQEKVLAKYEEKGEKVLAALLKLKK